MSDSQDILELAEEIVSLDKALRLDRYHRPEKCIKFVAVSSFKENNAFGTHTIYEGEELILAGVDVSKTGDLLVVMRSAAPATEIDPDTFHLTLWQAEDSFPTSAGDVSDLIWHHTSHKSAGVFANAIKSRLGNKPALNNMMQKYLTEGRRAVLEELHEREEVDAEKFYADTSDYGTF